MELWSYRLYDRGLAGDDPDYMFWPQGIDLFESRAAAVAEALRDFATDYEADAPDPRELVLVSANDLSDGARVERFSLDGWRELEFYLVRHRVNR